MKTTIIGVGAMGGALVEGMLKCPETNPSDITISDPSEAAISRFSDSGASITTDNKVAECRNDFAGVSFQQNKARGRNVQRQPEKCR